ncbi:MAG: iron-sulfur cluster assembly protein [Chloroflexi bacterium]|jgi:metal-sulfur cluster biosynthetic enzyme|nr:iron-sulfur cluster assembly protein [Chloroflexota bacterium]
MSEEAPANPIHWDIHDTHPDLVSVLRTKLAEVVDPEILLNVLQLGLVRKVSIENGEAKLYVLLTTPFCPYGPAMLEMIKQKTQEGLGMSVTIELGYEPWDFSLMEDPGALDWGMYT